MNKGKRCLLVVVCMGLLLGGKTVTAAGYLHWEQQLAFLTLQLPKPNKAKAVKPTDLAETTQSNGEITVQSESEPNLPEPQTDQTVESVSETEAAAVTKESTEPENDAEVVAESEKDGETDEETQTSGEASLGDLQ